MDDMRAQSAMQMIMHAGDARALAMQALDALNTFDVEGAREKLKEMMTQEQTDAPTMGGMKMK